jgi:hypothetical protein
MRVAVRVRGVVCTCCDHVARVAAIALTPLPEVWSVVLALSGSHHVHTHTHFAFHMNLQGLMVPPS